MYGLVNLKQNLCHQKKFYKKNGVNRSCFGYYTLIWFSYDEKIKKDEDFITLNKLKINLSKNPNITDK